MPSIDDIVRSNAGAELFNSITRMHLQDERGRLYFSRRHELTRRIVGMMLESHILPEEFEYPDEYRADEL